MTTTRHNILVHLKKVRSASAHEIARALELEPANVRHHLSLLAGDGRVELVSSRKLYGKGRPEKLYSLSRSAQGNNLARLAAALLQRAGPGLAVEQLAAQLLGEEALAAGTPARRLAALVARLNEMNYQARWEAGAQGPHVILGLCPYAEIIDGHPELCRLDQAMLERMLGGTVEHRAKLSPVCVFVTRT